MKVQNKTVIVTGGGNGMGRELVLLLLVKGSRVIALDINTQALEQTSALAGNHKDMLFTYTVNLAEKDDVRRVSYEILNEHGFIDGLINNAGIIQPFIKLNELSYEVIERVFNVNFFGTLYMTKAFLPHLISRPDAFIVNIASMGGFLPVPGQTIYCAAKAALKMMTEGLNAELTDTDVQVSIVFPGAMRTNIMANSGLSQPSRPSADQGSMKILSPADAAKKIIDGLEAGKSRIFVGSDSKLMDFIYRLNPRFASRLIYKKMKDKLSN